MAPAVFAGRMKISTYPIWKELFFMFRLRRSNCQLDCKQCAILPTEKLRKDLSIRSFEVLFFIFGWHMIILLLTETDEQLARFFIGKCFIRATGCSSLFPSPIF